MDTILKPVRQGLTSARSPWADGFAQLARGVAAVLGDGGAMSPRTELFRPLPADPMAWLLSTFPTYFQNSAGAPVPLAPHHEEYWRWLWALRPGEPARTFISILARGGGKSTELELGTTAIGYYGLRRYGLYCSATQKQANDHIATASVALEALGVERAINRYGFSRGWNTLRVHTADGFTLDAIGLDAAMRGVRMEEARPDLIILDDLDDELDTLETIQKKIEILTRKILPSGATASLAVAGAQNLPNKDGIFAQLADGRAEFLRGRFVSGPHPALRDLPEQDWYVEEARADGTRAWCLQGGTPVWAGQDVAACEKLLNDIGPQAFAIECLHRIGRLGGTVFQGGWFRLVDDWPRAATLVRYWDFAATAVEAGPTRRVAKDPDWTVGLLLARWQGQFWVLDVRRERLSPHGVEALVKQTAALDGPGVAIWLEEEGGASGKTVTAHYRREVLVGYAVHTWHPTGAKGERMKNVASAAEAGNVLVVQAPWAATFVEELAHFGVAGWHDDQADALSGAHYALTLGASALPSDLDLGAALAGLHQPSLERRAQRSPVLAGHAERWLIPLEEDAYG